MRRNWCVICSEPDLELERKLTKALLQRNEQHAAKMTNELMHHFSDVMSNDIDAGKKVTHEELGERIERRLEDTKFWRKLEIGGGVRTLHCFSLFSHFVLLILFFQLVSSSSKLDSGIGAIVLSSNLAETTI